MQAMISAFELYDLIASSSGARQAYGMHGCFSTTVAKTNHLDWKSLTDFLRQLPLHVVRHSKHGASRETFFHCFHNCGMTMSRHESAEAQVVIDIFVSIEVAKSAALRVLHEDWIRIVGAVVARDPERDAFE